MYISILFLLISGNNLKVRRFSDFELNGKTQVFDYYLCVFLLFL